MWTTIGNAWAVSFLSAAVASGHLAHTILLTGPRGVGKTHLALEFAAALNCLGASRPCGECAMCRKTLAMSHPDLTFVEPDAGRIKIGQVRDLQRELSLSPFEGSWRVCIITDFQQATHEASNALLKTLEEPPSRVILVITATDADLLLPTIVSRCQTLALRLVGPAEIASALTARWGLDQEQARLIAGLSDGRVGWAVRAVHDEALLAERQRQLGSLVDLLGEGRATRIMEAEGLARRSDLTEMMGVWQSWWRDVMLIASGCDSLIVNTDRGPDLQAMAEQIDLLEASAAVRDTQQLLEQLDRNVNARLALEVPLLRWRRLERG